MGRYNVTLLYSGRETVTVTADSEESARKAAEEGYSQGDDIIVTAGTVVPQEYTKSYVQRTAVEMWTAFQNYLKLLGVKGFQDAAHLPGGHTEELCRYILTEIMHRDVYVEYLKSKGTSTDSVCKYMGDTVKPCSFCHMTSSGEQSCDYPDVLNHCLEIDDSAGSIQTIQGILDRLQEW